MLILPHPPQSAHTLPSGRCLLFVYGQLQPGCRPPRSSSLAWPDRVRGELFDLGQYPAAVKVGASEHWLGGYVLEIDHAELVTDLDAYEEVGEGRYRRVRTVTAAGFEVWIYEYARPIPPHARGPIERWAVVDCPGESNRPTSEQ